MTTIIDMASGTECEGNALYAKPRQADVKDDRPAAQHQQGAEAGLALVEATSNKADTLVPAGLDIARLLDSIE